MRRAKGEASVKNVRLEIEHGGRRGNVSIERALYHELCAKAYHNVWQVWQVERAIHDALPDTPTPKWPGVAMPSKEKAEEMMRRLAV
jgi:hypothetical protein